MERNEYETTIELLGVNCGVTVVYHVGSDDSVYIEHVYGPSGKDMYEQLAAQPMGEDASVTLLNKYNPVLGMIPHRMRWTGSTEMHLLYDELLYAHRSGG